MDSKLIDMIWKIINDKNQLSIEILGFAFMRLSPDVDKIIEALYDACIDWDVSFKNKPFRSCQDCYWYREKRCWKGYGARMDMIGCAHFILKTFKVIETIKKEFKELKKDEQTEGEEPHE